MTVSSIAIGTKVFESNQDFKFAALFIKLHKNLFHAVFDC